MPALQRELVYYLVEQLKRKPAEILVIGKDVDLIQEAFPAQYKVTTFPSSNLPGLQEKTGNKTYDAILVNNILNEFNYKQLEKFLEKLLHSLRDDGIVEVRHYLGDSKLNLVHYSNLFDSFRANEPGGKFSYGFKIQWGQGLRDTIYNRQDWQDHCWMLTKGQFAAVSLAGKTNPKSLRDFLDTHQYTQQGIRAYEWIFGHGFISPGGEQQNAKFLAQLDLKAGETVLDIGAGIGGNAFQIAKDYGAHVMGVDLSSNMVTIACERASLRKDTRVRFLVADVTQFEFEPNTFDVVYSRDCIIHIPDKSALFVKIFKWLKPGGKVLITDYMVGEKEHTDVFKRYLADRQYGLRPLRDYVSAAKSAGFEQVVGTDITDQLRHLIEVELNHATENQDEFMQIFPDYDYDHLVLGWRNKIGYIDSGDHKWGVIKAIKPA